MLLLSVLALGSPLPNLEDTTAMIAERDAVLFEIAFEKCEPEALRRMLDDKFRMLHDLGGRVAGTADAFVENYASDCQGKVAAAYRNKREHVEGSRKVQLLGDWGALEEGHHIFMESNGGGPWVKTGKARYIHAWRWTGETFVLDESLSVDHGPYEGEH
ncbi:MAG: nuclear transport factor 2 family protein [Pseudomonadota bacterium]